MSKIKNFDVKWNFYCNKMDKLNYLMALAKSNKVGAQSAGMRAFMYLYTVDEDIRNKVNSIIDDYIVYKSNGTKSVN